MGWITWTGKVLVFAGQLAQTDSVEEWTDGQGKAIFEKVARDEDHKLFKVLRARHEVGGDLSGRFEGSRTFTTTMQAAITDYPLAGRLTPPCEGQGQDGGNVQWTVHEVPAAIRIRSRRAPQRAAPFPPGIGPAGASEVGNTSWAHETCEPEC